MRCKCKIIIFTKKQMKKALLFIFTFCYFLSFSQSIYNPQYLYDAPGGLYEKDSLRNLHIDFYTPNYHSILVDSFFSNPKFRLPAMVTLNGITHDSAGVRYKGRKENKLHKTIWQIWAILFWKKIGDSKKQK